MPTTQPETQLSNMMQLRWCHPSSFHLFTIIFLVALAAFPTYAAPPTNQTDPTNAGCVGLKGVNPRCRPQEIAYHREYFYTGGRYVPDPVFRGNLVVDQLYVEKLIPAAGRVKQPYPLVFFHGGGSAGNVWLQTPDNRRGWASYFLHRGYAVYIIDQTSVGRSTQEDLAGYPLRIGATAEIAQIGFTAPELTNSYPQSQLHTQWPGVSRDPSGVMSCGQAQTSPQSGEAILTASRKARLEIRSLTPLSLNSFP